MEWLIGRLIDQLVRSLIYLSFILPCQTLLGSWLFSSFLEIFSDIALFHGENNFPTPPCRNFHCMGHCDEIRRRWPGSVRGYGRTKTSLGQVCIASQHQSTAGCVPSLPDSVESRMWSVHRAGRTGRLHGAVPGFPAVQFAPTGLFVPGEFPPGQWGWRAEEFDGKFRGRYHVWDCHGEIIFIISPWAFRVSTPNAIQIHNA